MGFAPFLAPVGNKQLVPTFPAVLVQIVGSLHCTVLLCTADLYVLTHDSFWFLLLMFANVCYLDYMKLVQNLCSDPRYYH